MTPSRDASLLNDPIYYGTVIVFAVLTTALPVMVGRSWFLPAAQTLALWLLALVAIRSEVDPARRTFRVLLLWVAAQFVAMVLLARFSPVQAEAAVGDGFAHREALLEWLFTARALPVSLTSAPGLRLLEVAGVAVGALLSGGLLGLWFLMRTVNLIAFGAGILWAATGSLLALVGGLQPWALLRIGGYMGLIACLAPVGFDGAWLPGAWGASRRRLFWIALALLGAGLLLELLLPGPWARLLGGAMA